jgi:hypothetical protein
VSLIELQKSHHSSAWSTPPSAIPNHSQTSHLSIPTILQSLHREHIQIPCHSISTERHSHHIPWLPTEQFFHETNYIYLMRHLCRVIPPQLNDLPQSLSHRDISPTVTGSDGAVTHVGASSNFPPPEFRTRDNFEKERKRRNDYIGKPVIEIDQKIQAGINSKSTSPLDKLLLEECQQRNKLELQNWIVFRCSVEENSLHPNHWEPCCSKYFLYHLNKTDWV